MEMMKMKRITTLVAPFMLVVFLSGMSACNMRTDSQAAGESSDSADTYLTEKKPDQSFSMNLGADRGIKVRREKILDKIKETYFGKIQRDTVVRSFAYKITAENIKNSPALLKIIDRVPVSKTDKIEIRDLQIQPNPTQENYQDKAGVHLWSFDLAPGEKREIGIEFTVTYPKGSPPYGL